MVAPRSALDHGFGDGCIHVDQREPILDPDGADRRARDARLVGDRADEIAGPKADLSPAADEQPDPRPGAPRTVRHWPGPRRRPVGRAGPPGANPDRGPRLDIGRMGPGGDPNRGGEASSTSSASVAPAPSDQADRRERDVDEVEFVRQRLDDTAEPVEVIGEERLAQVRARGSRSAARAGRRPSAGGRSGASSASRVRCSAAGDARAARPG